VLKIARTIAGLAGNDDIAPAHPSTSLRASLAEAIHLRQAEKAGVIVRAFKHLICWS